MLVWAVSSTALSEPCYWAHQFPKFLICAQSVEITKLLCVLLVASFAFPLALVTIRPFATPTAASLPRSPTRPMAEPFVMAMAKSLAALQTQPTVRSCATRTAALSAESNREPPSQANKVRFHVPRADKASYSWIKSVPMIERVIQFNAIVSCEPFLCTRGFTSFFLTRSSQINWPPTYSAAMSGFKAN